MHFMLPAQVRQPTVFNRNLVNIKFSFQVSYFFINMHYHLQISCLSCFKYLQMNYDLTLILQQLLMHYLMHFIGCGDDSQSVCQMNDSFINIIIGPIPKRKIDQYYFYYIDAIIKT